MTPLADRRRLVREIGTIARFGAVGLTAACVHASVAIALVEYGGVPAMAANVCGFLVAFLVSFFGHHHWSFQSDRNTGSARRMRRFFVLAAAGFVLNNGALAAWLQLTPWSDTIGIIVAIFVVPPLTFLGARFWAFAAKTDPDPQ
ncbi:GtrA family protein [Pannonibacter carbonis]|uniref:GtrA family protein n=1 Tax=Pannonibacter carbonis TaxID=2067569 RepID=UPI000D10DAE3|nr:GtrA family protein [Pannonibacter carbonis]